MAASAAPAATSVFPRPERPPQLDKPVLADAGLAAFGGGHASVSEGTSTHLTGRPLLTPDEAMRLPPHLQVLLRPGKAPALARKLHHYADPEFAGLADG